LVDYNWKIESLDKQLNEMVIDSEETNPPQHMENEKPWEAHFEVCNWITLFNSYNKTSNICIVYPICCWLVDSPLQSM
jgi:hypothetical protein